MSISVFFDVAGHARVIFLCGGMLAGTASVSAAQDLVFKSPEQQATLVELYSSEGCSSCPPAEEWLGRWKENPDLWSRIVPVVFHVDYWDGLGWPDRFARPEYTERQRDAAARLGQDSVYTPEFVVNGREWRGWFKQQEIPSPDRTSVGILSLSLKDQGRRWEARFAPASPVAGKKMTLQIAWLGSTLVSDVSRGENAGRKLRHEFVVLGFLSVPLTSGDRGVFQGGMPIPPLNTSDRPRAVAAWVVSNDGLVVQATGGWLAAPAQNP